MRAIKAKKIRHAMAMLLPQFGQQVIDAVAAKFRMPNRHGEPQHRVINPKRQFKLAVRRILDENLIADADKGGVLLPNP